jgi:hypothetical protein
MHRARPVFSIGLATFVAMTLSMDAGAALKREKGKALIQDGEEVLFRVEYEKARSAQDVETYLYRHLNSDRTLAIEEKTRLVGDQLSTYTLKNKQTGLEASLQIRDGVATYTRILNGKKETSQETLDSKLPMISGPQFRSFVSEKYEELKKHGLVRFLFPVLERAQSIEFEVVRRDDLVHEMRPSNPIYQMFVRKILIEIDPKTHQVRQIYGRIMPMVKEGSDWKTIEAMTVFSRG